MKICSPQLGLSSKSTLGGEVHDHFILQGLADRGHKIFIYLPKGRNYEENENFVVTRAPLKHIPAFLFNILIIPYLFSTYSREKFDILRVHNPYFIGLGALILKFFHPKVKIVATHHLAQSSHVSNFINTWTAPRYDAIITVSSYLGNWLNRNFKVPRGKITIVYNGVDPNLTPMSKNQKLVEKYNLSDKFVILFMGLLIPRKNPMFLLEVFRQLKGKHPDTALIICGHGPLKTKILKSIDENKLRDVHLVAPVFYDDKKDLFNLCDTFALPSQNEGFGIVVAEAMACAKPIIAADNSSLREIITDGKTGYLVGEKAGDWVDKIQSLMESKDLMNELGKNAEAKAKEFSWGKATLMQESVFKRLIKDDQ